MGRKSLIESSTHYNEILDMIKEGLNSEDISNYLKNEYGEIISARTIHRYIDKIRSKINQKYYKKKKRAKPIEEKIEKEEAVFEVVDKGVSDLEALDTIIALGKELKLDVKNLKPEIHTDYVVTTPLDIVKAEIQVQRVIIQAVNTKARILKDDPNPQAIYLPVIVDKKEETELIKELEDELR